MATVLGRWKTGSDEKRDVNLDKRIFGGRWPAPGVRVGAAASTSQIFEFYFVFEIKHVTADHEGFLSSVRSSSRSRTKYSLEFA